LSHGPFVTSSQGRANLLAFAVAFEDLQVSEASAVLSRQAGQNSTFDGRALVHHFDKITGRDQLTTTHTNSWFFFSWHCSFFGMFFLMWGI
jgi:hypothetical protein